MIIVRLGLISNHHAAKSAPFSSRYYRFKLVLDGGINVLTIQQSNQTEEPKTRRVFVEPEISNGEDILEATAFFQVLTGGVDVGPDLRP